MANASEKFYDRFTFLYPVVDLFLGRPKRKFFSVINGYPTGRLLEIGVGNGGHFKYYKSHEVTGIDTSGNMLARAQRHAQSNIQLIQMDGEALRFQDQYFDYIVLSHVIAVVENPDRVLNECFRVLKPDGKLFILNHFTPRNWLRFVDRGFQHLSTLFHFKSLFELSSLHQLKHLHLVATWNAGPLSYFKVLVYEKKH